MATNSAQSNSNSNRMNGSHKRGKDKVPRVRWTPEEQTDLINRAATLMVDRQAFSLREAFNKAQEPLPVSRQRSIAALTQIPWFTDRVPGRVKEIEHERSGSLEQRIEEAMSKAREEAQNHFQEKAIRKAGEILAEVLLVALEDPRLRFVFSSSSGNLDLSQIKVNKTKLKRVVVAGTLSSQANAIAKEFDNQLDLRFWSKDQSNDTLKAMLQHADAAVAMVGFLSHPQDNIIKSSKVTYIPVSGGVTQIKMTLQKLLD